MKDFQNEIFESSEKSSVNVARVLDKDSLNFYHELMLAGHVAEAMGALAIDLYGYRAKHTEAEWKAFAKETVLAHPIREFIHRDPFTWRSFSKPRGYAGDAVMLDMIYRGKDANGSDDSVAETLLAYTTGRPAPNAVRNRAQVLANLIDEAVAKRADARILALAAGHLREVEIAKNLNGSFRGEIIALDQDSESLAEVERTYASRGIKAMRTSIKPLLAGKLDLQGFDLVYAAGLFDYLTQPVAKALSEKMFAMLNPGGRMLIANFVPDIPDVGYMESFMDWQLIYRDGETMRDLIANLEAGQIERIDITFDETRNIVYLTLTKRERVAAR